LCFNLPKIMRRSSTSRAYAINSGEEESEGCCGRMASRMNRVKAFLAKHFCDFCAAIPSICLILLALLIILLVLAIIPVAVLTYSKIGFSSSSNANAKEEISFQPVEVIRMRDDSVWPLNATKSTALKESELTTRMFVPPNVTSCNGQGFTCLDDPNMVIGKHKRCDGRADCADGSDEHDCQNCLTAFSCAAKIGSNQRKCLRGDMICNGSPQCDDGSDESLYCRENCDIDEYKCKDHDSCIPFEFKCDGDDHCPAGDDEIGCTSCTGGAKFCAITQKCIPIWKICDGVFDCPDKSDEMDCDCETCSGSDTALCKGEETDMCIQKSNVCDGVSQCPNGEDEEQCAGSCPIITDVATNSSVQCADGNYYNLKYACSGLYPMCQNACTECNKELAFQCADNSTCIHRSQVCDGRFDCLDKSDEKDCAALKKDCNTEETRCDAFADCPDSNDELNCKTCKSPAFHCKSEDKCIPSHQRCDGIEQCADGSDERGCSCEDCSIHPFPLYSCERGQRCFRMDDICDPHTRCPDPTRRDKLFCATRNKEYF